METDERNIRAVADMLLTGSSSSHQAPVNSTPLFRGDSTNTRLEYLMSGDLITGTRQGGRMSAVRRFFCLFVTFDLLFTALMWLICMMLGGEDIFKSLSQQVVHYSIRLSLFDVVMAAACRFTCLLLFYGVLYISHWCVIAISTAGTCSFLIAKVFLYNWAAASQPVFQVLLILTSFVISWGEAWFLDFRVLPQESQADLFLATAAARTPEQAPLLCNDDGAESVGNFYSPADSPNGSDDESGNASQDLEARTWRSQATVMLESSLDIVHSPGWYLEKCKEEGVVISSQKRGSRKVFRLESVVQLSPSMLLEEVFYRVDKTPSWNPTLLEAHRIEVVDRQTDVTYQLAAPGAGGMVSSREFVTLRHWEMRQNVIVCAGVSIDHPLCPQMEKHVRGRTGPSCMLFSPVPGDPDATGFTWMLDTELKGWLPSAVVQRAIVGVMIDYLEHLREHAAHLT